MSDTTSPLLTPDGAPAFTVSDLMKRWKMSRKAVLQAIADGHVKAFRPGRRSYRISAAEVARVESAAEAA